MQGIPVAWLQLARDRSRLAVAIAGIAFAVILMLVQLGLRAALYDSATTLIDHLRGDLVITSPEYEYFFSQGRFSQRRLYSALALDGVEWVAPLYIEFGTWREPERYEERRILVLGIDPSTQVIDFPEVQQNLDEIKIPDSVLFDRNSRAEYGPVAQMYLREKQVVTEVNGRRIKVAGLFALGATFGSNAQIITSDLNFLRVFPERREGLINMGFVKLKPGASPAGVQRQLRALLPKDVQILNRQQLAKQERDYWSLHLPLGFIFDLGALMGLVVGAVVVYQILFADVSEQLSEYATLKAMGYLDRDLVLLVVQEAAILGVLGFIPGYLIAQGVYQFAHGQVGLPIQMSLARVATVFVITVFTCCTSGALATRKLRYADPAEIF